MPRKQTQSEGSLDLLRDTICNTFGGVVFIALLVVLLLRLSPAKQVSASLQTSSSLRASMQWQEALVNNHELLAELQTQITKVANSWDDSVMAEIQKLQQMEQQNLQLKQNLGDSLLALVETEKQISTTSKSLEELKNQRIHVQRTYEETTKAASNLRDELDALAVQNEQIRRTIPPPSTLDRPVELPVERSDSNRQVTVFVKYGRVYFAFDEGWNINSSDFRVQRGWLYNVAEPKVFEGIPINSNGEPSPELAQRLSRFPPRDFFVHVAICKDSFDYFQGLKNQLSKLGYRYYLTPLDIGESMLTGSGPSSSQ